MTEWWIEHHFNPRIKLRLVWYVLGEFSEVKYLENRSPCYMCCTPQTTQNFIQIKSALYLQTYTEVGVTASGPGQLSIIEGNMNLALWQKILKDNIRSSVGELKLKRKSVMQQDNDHKHESKSTSDWVGNKINAWGWLKVENWTPAKCCGVTSKEPFIFTNLCCRTVRRVGRKPTNNVRQYSTAVVAVKGATNETKPASQFRQDKSSCAASLPRNVPHSVYVIYQTYTPNLAFSLGCVYSHPSLWLANASFNPFSTTESACRLLEIISHQPPICMSSMFPASDVVTNLQLCSHAEMNHFKSKLSDWTSYYFQGPIGFSHTIDVIII